MQRTSAKVKQLRGTVRADRLPKLDAGTRLTEPPSPPHSLSPFALREWRTLAPLCVELGVLTRADLRALELLCQVLATEAELRALLEKEGLLIPGAGGNSKSHPAVKMLESTRSQAHRLLADFGLTPRSRSGVDVAPRPKPSRLAFLDAP
jgi:P27 family predicted phage terminase small subunit